MISATFGHATVGPPGGCVPGTRVTPAWSGGPVSSLCLKSVAEKVRRKCSAWLMGVCGGCSGTHYCLPSHLQQMAPGKRGAPGHMLATQGGRGVPPDSCSLLDLSMLPTSLCLSTAIPPLYFLLCYCHLTNTSCFRKCRTVYITVPFKAAHSTQVAGHVVLFLLLLV